MSHDLALTLDFALRERPLTAGALRVIRKAVADGRIEVRPGFMALGVATLLHRVQCMSMDTGNTYRLRELAFQTVCEALEKLEDAQSPGANHEP